jgi:hypothetical protein
MTGFQRPGDNSAAARTVEKRGDATRTTPTGGDSATAQPIAAT